MDPITMATLTSAVTVLGTEYIKGLGSEAGKATWNAVKKLFGWTKDPDAADLPHQTATALTTSPDLAEKVWELLKSNQGAGVAGAMVGKIEAKNVTNIQTNFGPVNMS